MSRALYDFKKYDPQKLVRTLQGQGYRIKDIAPAINRPYSTVAGWGQGKYRPSCRVDADGLIDYSIRNLSRQELEDCGVYP